MEKSGEQKPYLLWGFFLFFAVILTSCSSSNVENIGRTIIGHLTEEKFEDAYDLFSEELKETISVKDLEDEWEKKTEKNGPFKEIKELSVSATEESSTNIEADLEYSEVIIQVRLTFNSDKKVTEIYISDGLAAAERPEDVMEEEVVIGKGTSFPLKGTLTLPKAKQERIPAVILVHGSGPSDRDESVYGYKPFRDIAWGLAQKGTAVLRYEKRTYAYHEQITMEDVKHMTVKEETIEDAVQAAGWLKNDPRIDPERIYIIGHSLGGMLAPRIDAEGGDFAGLIILAGSPRPLWEIIHDQNIAALKTMELEEETRKKQEELLQEQVTKAKQLQEMTKEQALEETIFGIPAYYLKEMDEFDSVAYLLSNEKPIFFLQGEDDFQVYFMKDFALWQEMLQKRQHLLFKSYPGLNHFFVHYEGPLKGTVEEYKQPAFVSTEVIEDIAEWILSQS